MHALIAFLKDDDGSAIVEYALTFALFGLFAVIALLNMQYHSGQALVNTRARMVCNSITQRPNVVASVDGAGNISCT